MTYDIRELDGQLLVGDVKTLDEACFLAFLYTEKGLHVRIYSRSFGPDGRFLYVEVSPR